MSRSLRKAQEKSFTKWVAKQRFETKKERRDWILKMRRIHMGKEKIRSRSRKGKSPRKKRSRSRKRAKSPRRRRRSRSRKAKSPRRRRRSRSRKGKSPRRRRRHSRSRKGKGLLNDDEKNALKEIALTHQRQQRSRLLCAVYGIASESESESSSDDDTDEQSVDNSVLFSPPQPPVSSPQPPSPQPPPQHDHEQKVENKVASTSQVDDIKMSALSLDDDSKAPTLPQTIHWLQIGELVEEEMKEWEAWKARRPTYEFRLWTGVEIGRQFPNLSRRSGWEMFAPSVVLTHFGGIVVNMEFVDVDGIDALFGYKACDKKQQQLDAPRHECSICLGDIEPKHSDQTTTTPCMHIFHTNCLVDCHRHALTKCPNCRFPFISSFINTLAAISHYIS